MTSIRRLKRAIKKNNQNIDLLSFLFLFAVTALSLFGGFLYLRGTPNVTIVKYDQPKELNHTNGIASFERLTPTEKTLYREQKDVPNKKRTSDFYKKVMLESQGYRMATSTTKSPRYRMATMTTTPWRTTPFPRQYATDSDERAV